jgi:hypothetical protein
MGQQTQVKTPVRRTRWDRLKEIESELSRAMAEVESCIVLENYAQMSKVQDRIDDLVAERKEIKDSFL